MALPRSAQQAAPLSPASFPLRKSLAYPPGVVAPRGQAPKVTPDTGNTESAMENPAHGQGDIMKTPGVAAPPIHLEITDFPS
ncbi:hypothetical protein PUN4_430068 [Paraburkholderia unamae]|nr:hypothetical protein PUN4_430068 [Paraburkholderia unamae]